MVSELDLPRFARITVIFASSVRGCKRDLKKKKKTPEKASATGSCERRTQSVSEPRGEREKKTPANQDSSEISNKVLRMDTLFSISPPEHFDFSNFGSWPNWIRRFERFLIAAGISERSQEYQVNSLIYTTGDKADDIMCTLALSKADRKEYDKVKEAFEKHFVYKHNVIYERAKEMPRTGRVSRNVHYCSS